MMTHRQRVLTALDHREPDRVPRGSLPLTPAKLQEFTERTGRDNPSEYWGADLARSVAFRRPEIDPEERFGSYFAERRCEMEFEWAGEYPAEWGVGTRRADFYHFGAPVFPLQDANCLSEIESYPYPDYVGEWGHDHFEEQVRQIREEGYPALAKCQRLFQNVWYLRSRERLFVDMRERPAIAAALFENVTRVVTAMAVRMAESGIDILAIADDIAMQDRMMISPQMWREWVKPCAAEVFGAAKSVNPDLKIFYHTDGDFEAVMSDLIEIGVDCFSTVQPECMDLLKIKRTYGSEVTLGGTIGVQGVFRFGTPDEVREMVRRQIEDLAPGGGFILKTANAVEPDVPWENIEALCEAAERYC